MKSKCSIKSIKLPPVPEMKRPTYKKPEIILPPGAKAKKLPCPYNPQPAPVQKKKTRKERAKEMKAPIRKPSLKYNERRWTDERINVLIDLYNQGLTYAEIGNELGINDHTASTMVTKLRKLGRITKTRCTSNWPEEQDRMVIDLYNKGTRYVDIAKALKKSESTIQRRIDFLKSVGELTDRRNLRCKKQ